MQLNWIQEAVNIRISYERSANPKSPSSGLKILQAFTLAQFWLSFWALKRARSRVVALILCSLTDGARGQEFHNAWQRKTSLTLTSERLAYGIRENVMLSLAILLESGATKLN